MLLNICERFHKLPSEVLAEDVELLRLMQIVHLGEREEVNDVQ